MTTTTTVPSPAVMAKFAKPQAPAPAPQPSSPEARFALAVEKIRAQEAALEAIMESVEPGSAAKVVRPGTKQVVVDYVMHDGVVKAKHLKPGQRVRPWLHDKPRGSERVVASVERIEDGAFVKITYSTPHPEATVKAAYRFHDADLMGEPVPVTKRVAAFVAYEEV